MNFQFSNMWKDVKAHFWHYLILILVITAGGLVFFATPDKMVKFQIGSLTALAYILWGIFHHLVENSLNFQIVVEYSLIGLLSIILLGGALL